MLTWLPPTTFVGVIPASYFLDRNEKDYPTLALLTPVMGVIVLPSG